MLPGVERIENIIGRMISRAREKAGVGDTGWREGVKRNRERRRIERVERRGEGAGSPGDGPDPTSLQRQSRLF